MQAIHGMATATDARIFKRLREQQRQIELQQQEIDQIRFEKEILQEETKRLREISRKDAMRSRHDDRRDVRGFPQLHAAFDAKVPVQPLPGTRDQVLFDWHQLTFLIQIPQALPTRQTGASDGASEHMLNDSSNQLRGNL
eukprot:s1531_g1.t1